MLLTNIFEGGFFNDQNILPKARLNDTQVAKQLTYMFNRLCKLEAIMNRTFYLTQIARQKSPPSQERMLTQIAILTKKVAEEQKYRDYILKQLESKGLLAAYINDVQVN